MSLCDSCYRRLNTWSEELRKNHNGCNLLLTEECESLRIETIADNIDAEIIGEGWVSNGVYAFNNQIITKNVRKCSYFRIASAFRYQHSPIA